MGQPATLRPGRDHLPGLDGIRAVAVSAVLIQHFTPRTGRLDQSMQWGRLGVIMFFVLSGFLITGILLGYRDHSATGSTAKSTYFRVFYARRALRIFPIYYLTVLVLTIAGYRPVRDHILWLLSYTANISIGFFGASYQNASHFWSLCVEEQFYLIWPALILFTPKRLLHAVIVLTILGGVAYRSFATLSGLPWTATDYMLPGCLDSLGLGALLALYRHDPAHYGTFRSVLVRIGLFLGLPLLIALQVVWSNPGSDGRMIPFYVTFVDLAASAVFVALVDTAGHNARSVVARGLSWSPLRYIGKISYGIYLYHFLLNRFMPPLLNWLRLPVPKPGLAMFFLYSATTIAVAMASWHFIERPFNQLKSRFTYLRSTPRGVPETAT